MKGSGQLSLEAVSDDNLQGIGPQSARAPARMREAAPETCAGAPVDAGWTLEPHICRACMSRLVSKPVDGGQVRYHCTNCGLDRVGHEASALCCCGLTVRRPTRSHKSGYHLVDAGIRCKPNPEPRPDFPSLIIAAET